MSWLAAVPALGFALLLLVGPGYATARVLSLRGIWAWGLAAPASVSIIVLASLWSDFVGITWSVLPVGITTAFVLVVAFVTRLLTRRSRGLVTRSTRSKGFFALGALAVAAALLIAQTIALIGAPENFSQSFDNVFHLNAVRYVLETGSASPLTLGGMTSSTGGLWFYPSGWHAIVSLVAQTASVSIMLASNAVTLVVASVVWPASIVLLTSVLFGRRSSIVVAAALLSALIPAFPILMIDYGVLYPYFLGVSLVPALFAIVIQLLRLGSVEMFSQWVLIVALVGSLPGVAISHPGAFVAWMVLALIAVVVAFVVYVRHRPTRAAIVPPTLGLIITLAIGAVAWKFLKPAVEARGWPLEQSMGQAIGQAFTLSARYGNVPWLVVVLLGIGMWVLLTRRRTGDALALLAFAGIALLFIAASSFPWQQLRDFLTASWYNNTPRLAALLPLVAIPIAAAGFGFVEERVRRTLKSDEPRRWGMISLAAAIAVIVLLGQGYAMYDAVRRASALYAVSDTAPLLSTDELALLQRIPSETPQDAVIAGSAWTGAGLAYAISGREVIMPHMLMEFTDDELLILDHLADAEPGSKVCDALERRGVDYVLDFGAKEVHGAEHEYGGLEHLASSDAVEMIDREGAARLYEVTGCAS